KTAEEGSKKSEGASSAIAAKKSAQEIRDEEEEELQLAMALSLSQEEAAKDDIEVTDSFSMDPDLARYLNRSYWEERNERQTSRERSSPSASAPVQTQADNNYTEIKSWWIERKKRKRKEEKCRETSQNPWLML
ncbi:hypothetical protein OS493_040591, partial [Desmophyllum pertusum]